MHYRILEEMLNTASAAGLEELQRMLARFAPVDLTVDTRDLSAGDQRALAKLVLAARIMNRICFQQLWAGNLDLLERLRGDASEVGRVRLEYFWLNKGPWSDLDEHRAFLSGVPERKPLGAAFYPEDMDGAEFHKWLESLSPDDRKQAEGFFTLIVRDVIAKEGGKLRAVPYSDAYRRDLEACAELLRDAAGMTDNETLRRFLFLRADAFRSNDYYESDLAWMDLDAPIDVTIGPYETYNDELFGFKAGFEAYVCVQDAVETNKLKFFGDHMQEVEDHLPLEPKYRNPKVGAQSPIRIVNQVFAAGEGDQGVKAAAFNLPNDERVITQKGSKRVMLKNVQEAKFNTVLRAVAHSVLAPDAVPKLQFDSFFTHILAHEMSHGIGPHQISVNGRPTTPRQELKELYSAIEEAKADTLGLFMMQHFIDRGYLTHCEESLYTTFLASSFRTMRFGLNEAHGKGMALQFNYLMDQGAFVHAPDGWRVDSSKVRAAISGLAREVLTIEATGDYAGAKKLLDRLAVMRPETEATLARLSDVPVDIRVRFTTADAIAPEQ